MTIFFRNAIFFLLVFVVLFLSTGAAVYIFMPEEERYAIERATWGRPFDGRLEISALRKRKYYLRTLIFIDYDVAKSFMEFKRGEGTGEENALRLKFQEAVANYPVPEITRRLKDTDETISFLEK